MFGKPLGIEMINSLTDDYVVAWKEFVDSVVIIGIASGCSVDILNKILESVFNAVVLIVGTEEVKTQRNIERLKRELRVCYPLIDRLLDSLDCGDSTNKHSSDLAGFVETILCPENHLIQIVLDSFTECVDSMFSCVLISGKIAAATQSWWSLHPDELKLLSLLATSENTANSKDIPVFLPYKSPTVAFRFVACTLIPEVQLCCLCGPTPVLNDVEHSVMQCFKNSTDILNSALHCFPKNFPNNYAIDGNVLGLLLVNTSIGKYMISKSPQQNSAKKPTSSSHRLDILRTFFYRAVLSHLVPTVPSKNRSSGGNATENNSSKDKMGCDESNVGTETYWCSEYHKCHAVKSNENILCVLYSSSVPTHCMRLITQKTIKQLISDKQVCW
ncbi:protein fuzzy homolog isoform X2 [Anoplophora glabripennis]|nr:protein fuzzy homolog isoform X2 [Anoplophora glabripennis]